MNAQRFSGRRAFGYRLLSLLIAIGLLSPALAVPPVAHAQTQPRPGATDPAANFFQWRNDEIFVTTPQLEPTWYPQSRVYETSSDLASLTLKEQVNHTTADDQHDAVAAAAGHILTPDRESVVQAYRTYYKVEIKVFGQSTPSATRPSLADRVAGYTDFIDIAAGDLDGFPAADGERRDEVVVVYAQSSSTGSLPVEVAVLDFGDASEAAPNATAVTTAKTPSPLINTYFSDGSIKPSDNALAVATGDFDGNGMDEIAVATLVTPSKLSVDIFRYTVTMVDHVEVRSLTLAGSSQIVLPTGRYWMATLSAAAGDFNGDGRSELAIGTANYDGSVQSSKMEVNLGVFAFTGTTNLTVTLAQNVFVGSGYPDGASGRVQLAAGLFKFDPNPASGWGPNRRQLAVIHTSTSTEALLRTVEFGTDLTPRLNPSLSLYMDGPFWLVAGGFRGFKGDLTTGDPSWSLALMGWSPSQEWFLSIYQTAPGAAPVQKGTTPLPTYTMNAPASGARLALVAYDRDGDTVYLGEPVHFTLTKLVNTDFILQEPPKHVYWDPVNKQVVNVSRYDGFNISLVSESGQQFKSESTDTANYAMGSSLTASASATVGAGMDIGVAKASASVTTEAEATVGQDYSQNESTYNSQFGKRTVGFSGATNRDDFIVGRLQTLDVWRYRVYGLPSDQGYPFLDIVLPGPAESISTQGGALNFDWYQPTHENGNILSYPAFSAAMLSPDDLGSFTLPTDPAKTPITGLMYPGPEPILLFFDGDSGTNWLQFSEESGGGTTRSYSHTMSENASIKASTSVSAEAFGVSAAASASLGAEFSESNSWGNTATSNNVTSQSTEIKLSRPTARSDQAYGFYPLIYVTTNGTIKATYAVDPTASTFGQEFWRTHYSLPDLALNLPKRFVATGDGVWIPVTGASRKEIRGFFVRKSDPNPVTGAYNLIPGAMKDGATVRLETRIYNYSVGTGVPAGGQACFSYVAFDPTTYQESGSRTQIGCATLPALSPQAMTTASVVWNTTGLSGGTNSQQYRIYVDLTAPTGVTENYPPETAASSASYCDPLDPQVCIDPGQNNEGFAYVTVAAVGGYGAPFGVHGKPADIGMAKDAMAAIDRRGKIVTGNVQAYLNRPLQVRITVTSDTLSTDFSYVLVYDGEPDQGGQLIAAKEVFVGNTDSAGTSVWFDWVPTTRGPHRLYAKVLQSLSDPVPDNNVGMLKVEVIPMPHAQVRAAESTELVQETTGGFNIFLPLIER